MPPGTGYTTVLPSTEALHRHAGPGPSFGTFCRGKVSIESLPEGEILQLGVVSLDGPNPEPQQNGRIGPQKVQITKHYP